MVRSKYAALAITLAVALPMPGKAAPLDDAKHAFERGDYKKAVALWTKLANRGDKFAEFNLGVIEHFGFAGMKTDATAAGEWFRKAADQGLPASKTTSWTVFAAPPGPNLTAHDSWFAPAPNAGDPQGETFLAHLMASRDQISSSNGTSYWKARHAAQLGDIEAQLTLAQMYTDGVGTPRDDALAVRWFQAAADRGSAVGAMFLASAYADGRGVRQDYAQAAIWAAKGAGDAAAFQGALDGAARSSGRDCSGFYSGRGGVPGAQVLLGTLYGRGDGVPKDDVRALYWFKRAACAGYPTANVFVGLAYANGAGVIRDDTAAMVWLQQAARLGVYHADKYLSMVRDGGSDRKPIPPPVWDGLTGFFTD
jgi:uncharacterized protein